MISSGVAVQVKGFVSWFQCVIYVLMVLMSWRSDVNAPSPDSLLGDDAERDLHLVEPGTIGGGEVERDVGMFSEPLVDIGSRMGGQVVEDDVDLSVLVLGDDLIHELEEFFGASALEATA
ncbi:MAG: hypothetical protein WAN20_25475 [Pseudonocardiaceae bacterium]